MAAMLSRTAKRHESRRIQDRFERERGVDTGNLRNVDTTVSRRVY
jgi:hypothetical protein